MKATELMKQTEGDANICIAVLDGPVDLNHPCFNKAKITQLEALVSGVADDGPSAHHGTHVASLIFGQRDSSIRGVSPGCRGLIIPVFGDDKSTGSIAPCSQLELAQAITQAVEQGAHVINISGGELVPSGEPHPFLDKAVRLCAENNVLIIAAAGNDGCPCLHVPASVSSTLAVGAMDAQGLPLDFSNWGQMYQNNGILALGDKLLGAVPCEVATKTCGVSTKSGTSFSTPIVTGIVALLLSIQRQRGDKPDPHSVRDAILQSAHPCISSKGLDCSRYLRGRLNVGGAYDLVMKKQQSVTDNHYTSSKIPETVGIGMMESFKRLPVLDVQNSEFTTFNPEIVASSTHISTLDAMKALENPDSIEPKSIDKKNKQKKNQIQENNMAENAEVTCGCSKSKKMENEITDQIIGKNPLQIHASDVQNTESTMVNTEVVTSSVLPAQSPAPRAVNKLSIVYALGTPSYDFGSEARRDAFYQLVSQYEDQPTFDEKLLKLLDEKPECAESLIWTLNIESAPVYAIKPEGPFASYAFMRLRDFLKEYLEKDESKKIERISIPGVISGEVTLFSGQKVPIIKPELRGMWSWNKHVMISNLVQMGSNDREISKTLRNSDQDEIKQRLSDFLDRVYYDCMNLGRSSKDRALNFAGTNAYMAFSALLASGKEDLELDKIETERSLICRPDSDCWDVKLTLFNPHKRDTEARKAFRFTIDVSDVVPVSIGEIRSWAVY